VGDEDLDRAWRSAGERLRRLSREHFAAAVRLAESLAVAACDSADVEPERDAEVREVAKETTNR